MEDVQAQKTLQFEFPPETSKLIDDLASKLGLTRAGVISKALGLLALLVQAHDEQRIFVERPKSGNKGDEFEIDLNP